MIRLHRLTALAVPAGIVLVLLPFAVSTSEASPKPSSNVIAVGPGGRRLTADPVLQAGERVSVMVTGFASGASVTAVFVSTATRLRYRADGHGNLHLLVVVPAANAGSHEIVFVGAPRPEPTPTPAGNVEVMVPLLGTFPYRLGPSKAPGAPGHGVEATSTTRPAGGSGEGAGGLGRTGIDVAALLALAGAAVVAGLGAVRAARRHH